jgi:hypothetical protein
MRVARGVGSSFSAMDGTFRASLAKKPATNQSRPASPKKDRPAITATDGPNTWSNPR